MRRFLRLCDFQRAKGGETVKLFINNKIEFKAKIEISNVRYLSLIQSAIDDEIQRFKNHGWDKDPDMKAYYQGYLEIKDALNNTYEW